MSTSARTSAAAESPDPFVKVGGPMAKGPAYAERTKRAQRVSFDSATVIETFATDGAKPSKVRGRQRVHLAARPVRVSPFADVTIRLTGQTAEGARPEGLKAPTDRTAVSWSGQEVDAKGRVQSSASFTMIPTDTGVVISGDVWSDQGNFHLEPSGDGGGIWYEIDPVGEMAAEGPMPPAAAAPPTESTVPAASPTEPTAATAAAAPVIAQAAVTAAHPIIDVLVGYTSDTSTNVQSFITNQIATMNSALANSSMVERVRLVGIAALPDSIEPTSLADIARSLDDLANPTNGRFDVATNWRSDLRADVVLVVYQTSAIAGCRGLARTPGAPPAFDSSLAFALACEGNPLSGTMLAHEIGHMLGGQHDPENTTVSNPYAYARGLRILEVARTIMAYPCSWANETPLPASQATCPVRAQYSNPAVRLIGTGTAQYQSGVTGTNDNARSMSNLAVTVARYRNTKTDVGVFRPSDLKWYSPAFGSTQVRPAFGAATHVPAVGDFNGDGYSDIATYGPDFTFYSSAIPGGQYGPYGTTGDLPAVADYNSDGVSDVAVYRAGWWYSPQIAGSPGGPYGGPGDIPVPGDYNGDGLLDLAIYRPTTREWWIQGQTTTVYGIAGAQPAPGDYNGDGITEKAWFNPTTGEWRSATSGALGTFGGGGDRIAIGDYDGK